MRRTDRGGTLSATGTARQGFMQDQTDAGRRRRAVRPGADLALGRQRCAPRRSGTAMSSVIEGKPDVVRTAITVLLAEGHLLIEDVPGVGKTMLAKALARSIDCTVRRMQFTPDLLPSDITGVSVFNQDVRDFEFRPGAIFANVVVGDEINRASPKTQSALLECMEEGQVTVDGTTYTLQAPFIVMATQNPIEMEGTYPLPEAQRDRFMARISMGYPSPACRARPCSTPTAARSPLERPDTGHRRRRPSPADRRRSARVHASAGRQAVHRRPRHRDPRAARRCGSGASPRASLHLLRAVAGPRRARRPRPRAARRRAGARRAGPRAPAHPHGRDPAGPAHHRRRARDLLRRVPVPPRQPAERPRVHALGCAGRPHRRRGRGVHRLRARVARRSPGCHGLGFRDLTRVGVLLVALPAHSAVLVRTRRARDRRGRAHTSTPRGSASTRARHVTIVVRQHLDRDDARASWPRSGSTTSSATGRASCSAAWRRGERAGGRTTAVRSHLRGRHHLGPLGVRVRDPFGLANRAAVLPGTADLVVLPRVRPARRRAAAEARASARRARIPHMVALHGEDDVTIREYRDGDDLRRIHWPATARTGRAHGAPGGPAGPATGGRGARPPPVGHRGSGASGSFEWAVTAVRLDGRAPDRARVCRAPRQRRDRRATAAPARRSTSTRPWTPWPWRRPPRPQQLDQVLHAAHPLTSAGGLVIAVVDRPRRGHAAPRRLAAPARWHRPAAAGRGCDLRRARAPPSSDSRAEALAGAGRRRRLEHARWSAPAPTSPTVWDALTAYSGVTAAVGR